MSTVVFLSGTSMGDALGGIGRSYKAVFTELGYNFVELSLTSNPAEKLITIAKTDVEFVFAFMAIAAHVTADSEAKKNCSIWEMLGTPYISLYGDTPAYFFDRHVMKSPNFVSLYGFPEHCALRQRLPLIKNMIGTYLPTAVDTVAKETLDFKQKADGDLIFLKNSNDPNRLIKFWQTSLPPRPLAALMEIAAQLRSDFNNKANNQIDDLVIRYFNDKKIDVSNLFKLRLFFIAQLDDYLRHLKSDFIADALMDFPVQIHGNNWDHKDFSGKRLKIIPSCNYEKSRELIRNSFGTIDMSPNTSQAPHDRVLRAYGMYTLCLTNEQDFFAREIPRHKEFSYRFDKESLQSKVADVLANRKRSIDLGLEVADTFHKKFKPEAFAHQLLEAAAAVRLNQLAGSPEGMPPYFLWPPDSL